MRRSMTTTTTDEHPTALPTSHPLSQEIRETLTVRGVELELVDRICAALDAVAVQSGKSCPCCEVQFEHAEQVSRVMRKIDRLLDGVFLCKRK